MMGDSFSSVVVFWKESNLQPLEKSTQELAAIFQTVSSSLRQELVNSYIMGRVPPVIFVKGKLLFCHEF